VRRVADDVEIARFNGQGPSARPGFSPDGRFLAIGRDPIAGVKVWRLDGSDPIEVLELPRADGWCFSPDSRRIAVSFADGTRRLYDLETPATVRELGHGIAAPRMKFSPDGRQLAVATSDRTVQVVHVETGRVVADLAAADREFDFAWHADGTTLAIGPNSGGIEFWDVTTGSRTGVLVHHGGGPHLIFNATGELLLSHTWWDGGLKLWQTHAGRPWLSSWWGEFIVASRAASDGRILLVTRNGSRWGMWEVVAGREYRTIAGGTPAWRGIYHDCALSPNGWLLAATRTQGMELRELATGRELAFVPGTDGKVHFTSSGELFTTSYRSQGISRWPVERNSFRSEEASKSNGMNSVLPDPLQPSDREVDAEFLQLGPPHPVPGLLHASNTPNYAMSGDGRVIVTTREDGALVEFLDQPAPPIPLGPHADVRSVAISPNCDLVATGSWLGGVKVWKSRTGEPVADFPTGVQCQVEFSPDGRWLAASSDGGRLWRVGSWEKGPSLGGIGTTANGLFVAFSPPIFSVPVESGQSAATSTRNSIGRSILALAQSNGVIRLIDIESGRDIAELADPNQHRVVAMRFSPDGTLLLSATQEDRGEVHVWDLRLLRDDLSALGLDWDWPSFPPHGTEGAPARVVVRVRPISASDAAAALETRARQDIAQFRERYDANPNDRAACNNLAWSLAAAPEPLRDLDLALRLAEQAVAANPAEAMYRNTLGLVYYRLGRYRDAVNVLEKNIKTQQGVDLAYDLFFLAMSHHKIGEANHARAYFDMAIRWIESSRKDAELAQLEELAAFRAEAEEVLNQDHSARGPN
jgi:WD40 repeat protein